MGPKCFQLFFVPNIIHKPPPESMANAPTVKELRDIYVRIAGGVQPPAGAKKKADLLTAISTTYSEKKADLLQQINQGIGELDRLSRP